MRGRSAVSPVGLSFLILFVVSISVCSMLAQTASQPEAPGPVHLTQDGEAWVAATLRSLSLEEKIGQMLQGRCFLYDTRFKSRDYKTLKNDLEKYHLGSLVVAAHVDQHGVEYPSPLEAAKVINQLQTDSKLPLLFAADLERGLASRLKDVPDFPWPMAFGAVAGGADTRFVVSAISRSGTFPISIMAADPSQDRRVPQKIGFVLEALGIKNRHAVPPCGMLVVR